jgi:hypothetical protein
VDSATVVQDSAEFDMGKDKKHLMEEQLNQPEMRLSVNP